MTPQSPAADTVDSTHPPVHTTVETTVQTAEHPAARPLRVLVAVVFAVLLVLAGVNPWWMLPLAAVAAPLGLTTGGARLGVAAMTVAAGAGAVAVLAGWADLRDALVTVARDVVTGVLPWSVALAWRVRQAAEADAAMALLREQDAQRLRAETDLARQRLHLAESLHDDLGHALSLVAVNLGRLELELERNEGTGRAPGTALSARKSVGIARRQVADAVVRLGDSVRTLRTGLATGTTATDVQRDLDALVQGARRAGADVELTGSPGPERLALFGAAVPRVVQEGLTNALKHAPGHPVRVELDAAGAERLVVTVRNPLPTPAAGPAPGEETASGAGGTGVRSLIEHVRSAGGSVEAGPAGDDYVLRAELRPVSLERERPASGDGSPGAEGAAALPAAPEPVPRDARTVTHGLVRARRRGGALVLAAVLVSAAALVAVAAAIQLADTLEARRALLGPAAFARISVGDTRSDVRPLLPATALDPPAGADPSCDYYAVTADPLHDASGDAYRLCWTDDRVSSTGLVVGGAE